MNGGSHLRLEIPCRDEDDFYARLADHVAQRGVRVATEERLPVGSPVTVALEMRGGGALIGEGVVDAHVRLERRSGVNVRILRFERRGERLVSREDDRTPSDATPAGRAARGARRRRGTAAAGGGEPMGEAPLEGSPGGGGGGGDGWRSGWSGSVTASAEIVAAVGRGAARARRAAIAVAAIALAIAAAGLALTRWAPPAGSEAALVAHLEASDRLQAEGRLVGRGGALEHLLSARRLRPDDARTEERLSRAADLLEALAARAIERGDLAVAEIHLSWAARAAPERASLRARLDAVRRRARPPGR